MQSDVDIKNKIEELRAVGSPSSLSKMRELEWVLGIEDSADEESDMLTDILLGNIKPQPADLKDQLPEFARDHVTYSFDRDYERFKELSMKTPTTDAEDEEWQTLREKVEAKKAAHVKERDKRIAALGGKEQERVEDESYETEAYTRIPDIQTDIAKAELISSQTSSGKHRPLLDLDIAATIIPSSTQGHGHLYIDRELTWKQYTKLLNVLADLKIIEPGYRGASIARGYTALRLPWIKKTEKDRELDKKKKERADKRKAEREAEKKREGERHSAKLKLFPAP